MTIKERRERLEETPEMPRREASGRATLDFIIGSCPRRGFEMFGGFGPGSYGLSTGRRSVSAYAVWSACDRVRHAVVA